jgi:5'-nucleotidase (lipoprotein e(P4) family)
MRTLALLALPLVAACAPAAVPTSAPAPVPASSASSAAASARPALSNDVHWYRNSAEQRALYLQAYRGAGDALRELARGKAAGTWAVILDADETVLDNSTYQKERWQADSAFSEPSWNAWVRRIAAPALPGAAAFIRGAREMGGRVVIVTNRDEAVCEETRENLRRLAIAVDAVLCKPAGPSDKNPRFAAVSRGTTGTGLPALEVLMWVGDNIQDFPGQTQAVRTAGDDAFARFGRSFVVLPNPMYGSWERNPRQ